ncbi:hypothetical protein [uncultured Fibrobacter sp.]|uniref:hypothetical protein n=1 Tax=uncultured Fibrobacter sp. TaxID=261512 RepID=UPI0025FA4C94|nr:hypothetical protein [uncultured Fibrobacter sp.]
MARVLPSSMITKIRQEAALFDSKDRFLNFATKGVLQSPLILEAGDIFYEKWAQSGESISLDAFLPVSANFTAQQKVSTETQMLSVLRQKYEDFGKSDLYLILGFLKWDGNALAPTLLVPVDFDLKTNKLSLSKRPAIENVILRERLKDVVDLPRVEDASINGQFSILLYFSLFEKAVLKEKKWKFTRHGLCLSFANGARLRLKKHFERDIWEDKLVDNRPVLQALFGEDGFQMQNSYFDEGPFDDLFNPVDHHFPYPLDSHTTKAVMESLLDDKFAFAVQTLPGTAKDKVAANIVAESVVNGKKTLVVSRRAITRQIFENAWKPQFRSFQGPDREVIDPDFIKARKSFIEYYRTVNENIEPAGAPLSDLLTEFALAPATKAKFSDSIFDGVDKLDYATYNTVKGLVEQIHDLYFNKQGVAARKAFQGIKVLSLSAEEKEAIVTQIEQAVSKVKDLQPIISLFKEASLFPTGIFISSLAETIDLIINTFDDNTPVYEDWELRSNNWIAYHDSLKALPEAGDNWVRYRRQTSDIYTDDAVDQNVYAAREEFVESLNVTLKGLSDRYRSSRRALMKVLRHPKSVSSDAELLDLIDTLLELQENKRAYKDTAVLGNHLLGKDWKYEKSNWFDLNTKIKYLFNFRDKHESDPRLDFMLQILENWHNIKPELPKFKNYAASVKALQEIIHKIAQELDLENPLESLPIEKWVDKIQTWSENWDNLDTHTNLTRLFRELTQFDLHPMLVYLQNADKVSEEFSQGFRNFWSRTQIQQLGASNPELFSLSPKERHHRSKDFRALYDQFCKANFRAAHAAVEANPSLLTHASLDETFEFDGNENFDIVVFLDADCTSIVESLPALLSSQKVVLMGNPHYPAIEVLPNDAYNDVLPRHTAYFQESLLAESLRRGIPTRELWLAGQYSDMKLVNFANNKIFNQGIRQFPRPVRENGNVESIDVVTDKIMAIANAAVYHAQKHPAQTLGIIAFHQSSCIEIEEAIRALIEKGSAAEKFFNQENPLTRYYVKTPERATDKYRDVVLICAEPEAVSGTAGENKLAVCSTLAKQEMRVFISNADMAKHANPKATLFWEWISYLKREIEYKPVNPHCGESRLRNEIVETLTANNIKVNPIFETGNIAVGPVIVDANNPKRFLALIEDDCTRERFRESIEDTEYMRPNILRQLGWKVLNIWLPFWFMSRKDEESHLLATIAIEQSVAPPPPEESSESGESGDGAIDVSNIEVVPYKCTHPNIEGTAHDKPIPELPTASLITQMKFYVDHESPIHEDLLRHRLMELHHVDREGPMIQKALTEAINQGLQAKKFIKTGTFFYSIKPVELKPRDRSLCSEFERKFAFVAPEERALLPSSMDEYKIKQTLGLLE